MIQRETFGTGISTFDISTCNRGIQKVTGFALLGAKISGPEGCKVVVAAIRSRRLLKLASGQPLMVLFSDDSTGWGVGIL